MPRYEIIGPDGKIAGTASELKIAKEQAATATKLSGIKHTVRDTSKTGVSAKNAEILKQIKNLRGGAGGGFFNTRQVR